MGFVQAGFEICWANEIDPDACKTYRLNFPSTRVIEGDIKDIEPCSLESVDVITAGFPCQSFSVCGNQKGFNDKRGNLFFEIIRIVDVLNPSVIFLENVANLTEHDNGRTFNVMFDNILSVKAPFIMDLFSFAQSDVEKYSSQLFYIPENGVDEAVISELKNKYFKRMTYDSIKKSYKTFIRLLLVSDDEECIKNTYGLYTFTYRARTEG